MKVTQDSTSQDYLKKLNNTQKHLIIKKEEEIKNLNKHYDEKVRQAQIEGDTKIINQHDMNKRDVAQSISEKENHLNRIKKDMQVSAAKLQEQKQNLTTSLQDQIENTNTVFDEKIRNIHRDNMEISKDLNEKTKTEFKKLQHNSDLEIKKMNQDVKSRANNISRDNKKSMRQLEMNQQQRKDQLQDTHKSQIELLEKDHNDKVVVEQRKHMVDYNQRVRSQQIELNNIELHHQEILKQKRASFKEKFNLLEKNHTEILDRIKTKFDSEIKDLVSKYSDFKNQTLSKLQDKFYNVSKLKPKVEDKIDHYIIKLEVPEHESELVNLTAQERDISISLTRKFDDKMTDQTGDNFKTRRSEVMNKSFKVDQIMDSSSVVRKYEEGMLTFKITKR